MPSRIATSVIRHLAFSFLMSYAVIAHLTRSTWLLRGIEYTPLNDSLVIEVHVGIFFISRILFVFALGGRGWKIMQLGSALIGKGIN